MIFIFKSDCCNLGSIVNAIKPIRRDYIISNSLRDLNDSVKTILLPGVCSCNTYINSLDKYGFLDYLKNNALLSKERIIGICAGAQVLFDSSEEGSTKGLGLLSGNVKKIRTCNEISVPHLGWNNIIMNQKHSMTSIFNGIDLTSKKFYFSHSYRFPDSEDVVAYADYGERFPAIVARGNIIAIQFHPEKSYDQGQQLLKNILDFKC